MMREIIEITISVLSALIAAVLGGYMGAWFQHWFQCRKVNKVRQIAIKALDVFCRYAKQGQTFDMAAPEFNNSLDVVEKRTVLVALCKLGIPIVKPIDDLFNIEIVKFEHKRIDKETINLMKGQVNKGNCDGLFFSDVDAYFSSNTRLLAIRAVAKKYVDIDFAYCHYDKQENLITHTKLATDLFTPGELNVLSVFRIRSAWDIFFDDHGDVIPERLEELKKEIDLGIWDTYLFWDSESYLNIQSQNKMTNAVADIILKNMKTQQNILLNNKKKNTD